MPCYNRFGEEEQMSDDQLFGLMRKALAPKPRMIVAKSINLPVKKDTARVISRARQQPSDRELLGALSHAVALGRLTGADALAAEKLIYAGKPLPPEVRRAILAGA
jgi:hypothetical protein